MTVNQLYRYGTDKFLDCGIEDAEFDARCLIESVLNVDTTRFFLIRSDDVTDEVINKFKDLIVRRVNGEPLQYILGIWEFMGNEFYVGPGVLIPRPETEGLVEFAVDYLRNIEKPVVIDLCSGSGCIAISIAKLIPEAKVYAVEKFDEAFGYLEKNIGLNSCNNVIAVKGDLFDKSLLRDIKADLILSNPPYIRKDDISTLSVEVQNEPVTALDGGCDGYDYYRFLSDYWLKDFLLNNSAMMIECGEDQGDYIAELFSHHSLKQEVKLDFNGLQRFVIAYK